ncbi:OmpA family protein [Hoeflea sp.]|uniref:OmpA family protein n=1 Tax=Hoeflea sp. TaxID=1940281 RepID=UPI003B010851
MYKKIAVAAVASVFLAGCVTTDPYTGDPQVSRTAGGAALGAAAGAGLGLLAGGNDRRNALIGAGIGALAGGAIGNYMDRQQAELRAQLQGTGVSVTRNGNNLILNMPSNVTFAVDQAQIDPSFYATLNSVAIILNKYNQSLIDVYGFTDSTGTASYNLDLSQRRAQSVSSYLAAQGIDRRRMYVVGFGQERPIASNASAEGRAQNRRVELHIVPLS